MASSAVPAKIVLKSTTKMSLSDRFTAIQKMARPVPPAPQEVRATMSASQQSTQANRRLAQQMANRPAVKAALGGGGRQMMAPPQMKSLKQRLGPSNIKARLSLTNGSAVPRGAPRGRGRGVQRGRGRGFNAPGVGGDYMVRGARGGRGRPRGRGGFTRGRGGFSPRSQDDDRWYPRERGRGRSEWPSDWWNRGGRGGGSVDWGRGQRGGRGRGRGDRGRGRGRGSSFSREQLDNQLEEYMSKTKTHLNSELDVYMANADTL